MEEHPEKALTTAGSPERLELLVRQPLPAVSEEIGRWSVVLTECRARTLKAIATIAQEELDWHPPFGTNTIGTLLYHIALIEADWLFTEILEQQMPEDLGSLLCIGDRGPRGELTNVHQAVDQHTYRLALVREQLLESLTKMTLAEFRRTRHFRDCDVTPEWGVVHLLQHEAEHRGQILVLRKEFANLQGR